MKIILNKKYTAKNKNREPQLFNMYIISFSTLYKHTTYLDHIHPLLLLWTPPRSTPLLLILCPLFKKTYLSPICAAYTFVRCGDIHQSLIDIPVTTPLKTTEYPLQKCTCLKEFTFLHTFKSNTPKDLNPQCLFNIFPMAVYPFAYFGSLVRCSKMKTWNECIYCDFCSPLLPLGHLPSFCCSC